MTIPTTLPDLRSGISIKMLDHRQGLYRHSKRHEWGSAILAWEEGGRRGYQFDDGKLRVFKEGYYSLIEPLDEPEGATGALVADLRELSESATTKPKTLTPSLSFEQQLEIFGRLFPHGFLDGDWIAKHRRRAKGKALKRHREHIAETAQHRLSKECLDLLLREERGAEIHAAVIEILSKTDLLASKSIQQFVSLDDEQRQTFATLLRDLLHGDGRYGPRFKGFMRFLRQTLGQRPSWRLATVLPALVHPDQHVCVRHSVFIKQAASVAPAVFYSKRPRRRAYTNFRAVAMEVKSKLEAAGLHPRDLMDVHDFIWATLRPAAAKSLSSS